MLTFFSSATRNSILSKPLKFPTPEYLISHFHSISRVSNPAIQFILEEAEEDFPSSREPIQSSPFGNGEIPRSRESGSGVQISHPWPEWIDLMKKLLKNGYFSGDGNPFPRNNESGIKDSNQIRTACLNFARDQFDLVRCNFLNFAKNTRCLQCKETPPKRALHPGEWECESCNYINFKRNMVCLKCDHRRPRASNSIGSSSLHACLNTNNRLSSSPYLDREKQFRDGVKPNAFKSDRDEFVSRNQEAEFADFPILGGKSDISRNEQKREKWKRERMERSTNAVKSKEEDFEFKSCFVETSNHSQLPNHEDEQMADWFGHKTIQNDKRFSP
ncbi:unnamed protein product [Cuscuta epithymum]|uniref:RanBP2-type domain-containing protein n=1 Tax=Cuscuta epithymum TaxID=186058 RepID=A0AAV0EED1_9ASTE|nr:unnamed protein product [Cuscuta epithymum]